MQPPSRFLLPTLLSAFLLLSGCDSTDADAEDTGEERVYGTAQVEGGASYAWTTPQSAALEDVPGFSTRLLTFTLFRPFPAEGGQVLRLGFDLEAEPEDLESGERFSVPAVISVIGQDLDRDGEPSLTASFLDCPSDAVGFECSRDHVELFAQGPASVADHHAHRRPRGGDVPLARLQRGRRDGCSKWDVQSTY